MTLEAKDWTVDELLKLIASRDEAIAKLYMDTDAEISCQRETIAELVAAVNDYQANEVAREKTCGHPWPCACASIRLHAALTKAKEAGK